jgi:hypothetical protein
LSSPSSRTRGRCLAVATQTDGDVKPSWWLAAYHRVNLHRIGEPSKKKHRIGAGES